MTKSLALDPHDLSSRGDLLPSRAGIPPRVASIIWNRNFPSLLSDPSTQYGEGSLLSVVINSLRNFGYIRDTQFASLLHGRKACKTRDTFLMSQQNSVTAEI